MSRRWPRRALAVLACLLMIVLHRWTGEVPTESVRSVAVGQPGRLYDSTVTVNSWTLGQSLYVDDVFVGRSAVVYLAVHVTVATDGVERRSSWQVGGRANGRTFAAHGRITVPQPGFRISQDVVFELDPDDLAGFTVTVLDREPLYAFDPRLDVDLAISAERVAETLDRSRYAVVRAGTAAAEVIR